MRAAELMDELVADLISKYTAEVLPSGLIRLVLVMRGHGILQIAELIKHRQMSVCYVLFNAQGQPVPEPEIFFYLDVQGHWIPYEFRRITAGHRAFAIFDPGSEQLIVTDVANQAELARYTDLWADVLREQGWLAHAQKYPGAAVMLPHADVLWDRCPDLETLMQWVEADGGCEATDGCWVEPDGTCEHGCKSWLLELGLI